jgi:transcriptional regulator with XRE-family HTH domain
MDTPREQYQRDLTWLRIARERRGFSQERLGNLAGFRQTQISRWERSHRTPRPSTARKLAKALGYPVEKLFPIDGPSPSDVFDAWLDGDLTFERRTKAKVRR